MYLWNTHKQVFKKELAIWRYRQSGLTLKIKSSKLGEKVTEIITIHYFLSNGNELFLCDSK